MPVQAIGIGRRYRGSPGTNAVLPGDLADYPVADPVSNRPASDRTSEDYPRRRDQVERSVARRALMRAGRAVPDLIVICALVALVVGVGRGAHDFRGFPKGYDALGHLATIKLILSNFPHFAWNYAWYGGFPAFPGSYPPLYSVIAAGVVALTHITIASSMLYVCGGIYVAAVLSCYGFVRALRGSPLIAGAAAVLLVACPTIWAQSIMGGLYPRLTAMAFSDVATFFVALDAVRPTRWRLAGAGCTLGAALMSHPVIGIIGSFQTLMVVLVAGDFSFERRIRRTLAVAGIAIGLSAWFYIPYFLKPSSYYLLHSSQTLLTYGLAIPYSVLFSPGPVPLAWLPAILLPAFGVLFGAALLLVINWPALRNRVSRYSYLDASKRERFVNRARASLARPVKISTVLFMVAAGCLGYGLIGHLVALRIYLAGINPIDLLAYAAWPLATSVGVLLSGIFKLFKPLVGLPLGAVALVTSGSVLASIVPAYSKTNVDLAGPDQTAIIHLLPQGARNNLQYRVGGVTDPETDWINIYTDTPENRGYFTQGILHINTQDWMESVMKEPNANINELRFLLDWYSIQWLFAGPGAENWASYAHDPADFQPIGSSDVGYQYRTYRYDDASPILHPSTAPPVLVVSRPAGYKLILRTLATGDFGPRKVVPVLGPQSLDGYDRSDLKQFPSVVLYDFSATNLKRDARLLKNYVTGGGHLFIEAAGSSETVAALAAQGAPIPVSKSVSAAVYGNWDFTAGPGGSATLSGINLGQYGPPIYGTNSPWGIEFAGTTVPGARSILDAENEPVVVQARYGRGSAIWSGLNLPYHGAVYSQLSDSELLFRLISSPEGVSSKALSAAPAPRAAVSMTADGASLKVPAGTTAVLFQEDDYPDWKVTVNGRPARIWPAGPEMQYVLIGHLSKAAVVRFSYELSPLEIASSAVSVLTLVAMAGWLCRLPSARVRRRMRRWMQAKDLAL